MCRLPKRESPTRSGGGVQFRIAYLYRRRGFDVKQSQLQTQRGADAEVCFGWAKAYVCRLDRWKRRVPDDGVPVG